MEGYETVLADLDEGPVVGEPVAGELRFRSGSEVNERGPHSHAVPLAEGHPQPCEPGGLAQRVARYRRAAVVGDVARELVDVRLVHGEQGENRVHRHQRLLQLRVRGGHQHVHRRELVQPL